MERIKLSRSNPLVRKIIESTFPDYTGRKVSIEPADRFYPDQSWDGGSCTYWKALRLDNWSILDLHRSLSNGMFNPKEAFQEMSIPEGCLIVQHVYFCGKDFGIRILYNPATENQVKQLTA